MDPVMSLLPPKESNLDTPNQKLNGKKTKDVTKISRKRKVHWLDDYCDDKQPSNDNLLESAAPNRTDFELSTVSKFINFNDVKGTVPPEMSACFNTVCLQTPIRACRKKLGPKKEETATNQSQKSADESDENADINLSHVEPVFEDPISQLKARIVVLEKDKKELQKAVVVMKKALDQITNLIF